MIGKPTLLIAAAAALVAGASVAQTPTTAPAPAPGAVPALDSGESLFLGNCSACHQATGLGVPGAFPALAGNKFVLGDPAAVASVVLTGRGGMPSYKADLDDATIAAVLTYVRSAWGNKASPVSADVVAAARAKTGDAAARGLQTH